MRVNFCKIVWALILHTFVVFGSSLAQVSHHDSLDVEKSSFSSLHDYFSHGEWEFHARSVWMSTYNLGELSDYSALAFGAGIGYKTPSLKGFSLGMSGYFIFRLHEHNLSTVDPLSGGVNRYELPLFDMNDPENGEDLDRLEELYLEYRYRNSKITIGRQCIETPFLNRQDNRMRPNLFSGIWAQTQTEHFLFEGGWIGRISPRGTVDWFDSDHSLGVYPFGRNIDGTPSQYKDNVSSSGIYIGGLTYKKEGTEMKVYNYYTDNLFNLIYSDVTKEFELSNLWSIGLGIQVFWQHQIGEGGHPDPSKKYIHEGEQTFGVGNKIDARFKNHSFSVNTLYIHDSGRFLFPREWGREQFWANLPRERFEGNGGLRSISVNWSMIGFENHLETFVGIGLTSTQDPSEAILNKNGMPSWSHWAGRVNWYLDQAFEGVSVGFLMVYKGQLGEQELLPEWTINRVDLTNYTLIIDYKF